MDYTGGMAHTTIKKILGTRKIDTIWITTVEDAEGNVLTGVGNDYRVGEPILTYHDDATDHSKFYRSGNHPGKYRKSLLT